MTSVKHYRSYAPARPRRRGNPYFATRRTEKFGDSLVKSWLARLSPRAWFFISLFFICLIAVIWLACFSNVFLVKNIEVQNTELTSSVMIQEISERQLTQNRLLFFSQKKLFIFNTSDLKQTILDRYALNSLKVVKKLPDTLIIILDEKKPAAVWFEADMYREIDAAGWVLAFTTGSVEGLPTIYNNGEPRVDNKKVKIDPRAVSLASYLTTEFPTRFSSITIKQLVIDNELNTLKLLPNRGALIYFSLADSAVDQLNRLDILLRSELSGRFEKTSYIDLRFKDKIYYK